MQPLHLDLNNFDGVFMEWVDNIVTKLGNYAEVGSGSVVLFIGSLDINVGKFKKNFIVRGWSGVVGAKYNEDLKGCKGVNIYHIILLSNN